ncbi:MAG: hypothetical protein PW844_07230 [Pantoea sp.]|uniref:hypothetical protein n=1 Tax=Pantoea sp. TaxID=69393 RepID=UPI0023A782F8|nr:hypothetical protein [Pantoea sp.]MDE1186253.1 hypothetical protein [Pantoea sp.]
MEVKQDEDQEGDRDPGLHRQHVGAQRVRQVAAEHGDEAAEQRQDQQPEHHRSLVIAPDARHLEDHRHQRMGILPDVDDGKIGDDMGVGQDAEGEGDEHEQRDRARPGHIHHRLILAPGADQRDGRDDDGGGQRQNQCVMSKLDDHLLASSPPFQVPSFFRRSATSFGM